MIFIHFSLGALLLGSIFSFVSKKESQKSVFSCFGVLIGSLLGLVPAVEILMGAPSLEKMWQGEIPGLILALGIDPLSAFFLLILFVVSALVAVYSLGYLKGQPRLVASYPFFPILVGAMAAVVVARDGFFLLICWEVMSLASYFLVTVEHNSKEVRYAGWIYLIATHLATAFLMVFFVLLYKNAGTFLFGDFLLLPPLSPLLAGLLFVFAVIGFGTKAGLFPFHVWLPHAHPAAPSPISALMSGVMIKMGIYGILRTLTFLGTPEPWWGALLMLLGILSTVIGILYAFMQEDIKRLLAYSSVENIGIITVAIGLGVLGMSFSNPWIMALGFAGALFHVLNHSLFKSLLFLGAGSLFHTLHTRSMSRLGGLLKSMPITGATFLIAAAAICGFPIFNGFVSEWLIYLGLFQGSQSFTQFSLFLSVAGVVAVAFAGGLAIATFTKAFGVIFLGSPRERVTTPPHEAPVSMTLPMLILALLCLGIGLYPMAVWAPLLQTVPMLQTFSIAEVAEIPNALMIISWVVGGTTVLFLLLFLLRRFLIRKKPLAVSVTWDCGYANPTSRMQYGAASFAEPMAAFFKPLLKPITHFKKLIVLFPPTTRFAEYYSDSTEERLFVPFFKKGGNLFGFLRRLQQSRAQDYLALMFATLILLLLWEVWFGI